MKTERAFSQENIMLQVVNKKKGHQKSRSDASGIIS